MRITQGMMTGNFLRNLNNNSRTMNTIQEQLSTYKRINRPSDDPVGVISSLSLRTALAQTEKYQNNTDEAESWLGLSETAVGQMSDLLARVRELVIQGANDTLPQPSRDAIVKEIAQIKEQMIQVGNTSIDGRYIFGGYQTTSVPFDSAGNYNGDSGKIEYEVGINVQIQVNLTGDSIIQGPGMTKDLFQIIDDVITDISNADTANLSTSRLDEIDTAGDNLLALRSEIGARTNRLELTMTRLEDATLNLNNLLSKNEDINPAEVITQLKMQENVYNSALAAGARIIQPTLLDFLR